MASYDPDEDLYARAVACDRIAAATVNPRMAMILLKLAAAYRDAAREEARMKGEASSALVSAAPARQPV